MREGPKHDVTLSLRVNRAMLVGVNIWNSMFLAGCSQLPGRLMGAVSLSVLNVSLSLCVQAESRRGQLMAEQGLDSGSYLCVSFMYPYSYSIGPFNLKDVS